MSFFKSKCSENPLLGWNDTVARNVLTYGAGDGVWNTMDFGTRMGVFVDQMEKNKTRLNCAYNNPRYRGLIEELRKYSFDTDKIKALQPRDVGDAVFAVFIKYKDKEEEKEKKERRTTLRREKGNRNLMAMAKLGGRRRRTKKRKSRRRRRKRTKKKRRRKSRKSRRRRR